MKASYASIRTDRLTLHPMQLEDAPALHRIYQSDEVLRYFPDPVPPALERVERFISGQQSHWEQHGYGNWGILLNGESELIGWAGLQFLPELDETEVGFLLDRAYWGKGYATEAARASLQFGFESLRLDHVIALVHPENRASIHVIRKCRMDYVNTLELWGIGLNRYRIDRGDWDRTHN